MFADYNTGAFELYSSALRKSLKFRNKRNNQKINLLEIVEPASLLNIFLSTELPQQRS